MPSKYAASMFGGAGGRGVRASVASPEGLRNMLSNDTDKDSTASASPTIPADDKQTMRGLNDRLSGYLNKVKQLEKENKHLQDQIDEILVKRKTPEERDWCDVEKPLDELRKEIKDIAKMNAILLLQIDSEKLTMNDFKNKLNDEEIVRKGVEKEIEDMKKVIEGAKLNYKQTEKEIDMVMKELDRLDQEHKDVAVLREKIKFSDVNVKIESQNSNLAEIVNKIRSQYEKLVNENLKESEEWFQSKFESIKEAEAQKSEDLDSERNKLMDLLKQKQQLEIKIQSLHTMINNHEETLKINQVEYDQQLAPINNMILKMEAELMDLRSQGMNQAEVNSDLLCVKMKLESEINNYQQLIPMMTFDGDSSDFSLEDALHSDPQKSNKIPEQKEEANEAAPSESSNSTT
ncbi:hypothetical protein PAMP_016435 [Pampus punctatissimus]